MSQRHVRFKIPGVGLAVGAAAALLSVSLVLRAEQGPPPAQAGAPRPLVPMTASSLLRDPAPHIGENVSLMATVETVVSRTAFTVDQDRTRATGREVLVLAPTLTAAPDLHSYVTVQGEVMRFDTAAIAKKAPSYQLDLSPEVVAKFQGQPVILATAVVTQALTDLAKRPIPPMTPDEITFSGWMKAINSASGAVRGGLDQPIAAQLTEQVSVLQKSFAEVEAFFKARGTADAAKWAGDAVKLAESMEAGLASGKLDEVKASAGSLQQLCAACHTQHRERMSDGTYRIKKSQVQVRRQEH